MDGQRDQCWRGSGRCRLTFPFPSSTVRAPASTVTRDSHSRKPDQMWKSGWGGCIHSWLMQCCLRDWLSCVYQVIRGAGHYVFADQPDDFNQTVLQILTRTDKMDNNNGWGLPPLEDEGGTNPGGRGCSLSLFITHFTSHISSVMFPTPLDQWLNKAANVREFCK